MIAEEGKLPNSILESEILAKLNNEDDNILIKPSIGEDCSAISVGEHACVLSCDPITGSVTDIGHLAVDVSCNDIASAGVQPVGLLVTVLAPVGVSVDDISMVMEQINSSAKRLNISILGGHTEVTSAVNRFVVNVTALGVTKVKDLIKTSGAKVGDDLVMTKYAGLEGTAIILKDAQDNSELSKYKKLNFTQVKSFVSKAIKSISVVEDGLFAAEFGAHAMHDATEGGILGAAWEMAEASGLGLDVSCDDIAIHPVTRDVCDICGIDPFRLIASGCMLIATANGREMIEYLSQKGIESSVIGRFNESKDLYVYTNNKREKLKPPESDELYKVISKHYESF